MKRVLQFIPLMMAIVLTVMLAPPALSQTVSKLNKPKLTPSPTLKPKASAPLTPTSPGPKPTPTPKKNTTDPGQLGKKKGRGSQMMMTSI